MTIHRYQIFLANEAYFPLVFGAGNSWIKSKIENLFRKSYTVVKDPEVRRKLIPTFEIGCKRITPHANYAVVEEHWYIGTFKGSPGHLLSDFQQT
jgi:hypothetical protein